MSRAGLELATPCLKVSLNTLTDWHPPPHLVEEVLEHGDVYRAFLAARGFRRGDYGESLAIRRQIQVHCPCVEKLLVRPHSRLAGHKRSAIHSVIHDHDPVIRGFVEQLAAVVRPQSV